MYEDPVDPLALVLTRLLQELDIPVLDTSHCQLNVGGRLADVPSIPSAAPLEGEVVSEKE